MRLVRLAAASLLAVACAPAATVIPAGRPSGGEGTVADAARAVAERHRVAAIASRRFTHAELWGALAAPLASPTLAAREIGRSLQGRPIRAITYGSGPTRVLLWSQMHGDESTATMALADIVSWLGAPAAADDPVRRRLGERLTVVMVPMLNPDGAELFQRENAAGIDVNRDARRLATPEARALKALRDSVRPQFGFNLHDQSARILAGPRGAPVAIALLAPAADASRAYGAVRAEARQVAAGIAAVLAREIPGRVAKYDDTFEPRAFGDLMQQWGTRTVLIESGALPDDPEKQRLRAVNVLAIVSALDEIASGRYASADPAAYETLPVNARAGVDLLVRGGTLVLPGAAPFRADLSVTFEDAVAKRRPRVREVGDLPAVAALDTLDASGLFVHVDGASLVERGGGRWLRLDTPVAFTLRRGPQATSEAVRTVR